MTSFIVNYGPFYSQYLAYFVVNILSYSISCSVINSCMLKVLLGKDELKSTQKPF